MSKLHDISDLEYHKLNQILVNFNHDAVLNDFNDDCIYINIGSKTYRLERNKVSPNISVEEAVRCIEIFE